MTKRIAIGCAIAWIAISFVPYPLVGEYWATAWMLLNYPMSVALKGIAVLEVGYPYFLMLVVTLVNAAIYGYVIFCFARLIQLLTGKNRSRHEKEK